MPIELNHLIVHARDSRASAAFLAEILGRPEPRAFGPFQVVDLDNGVSLDFADSDLEAEIQHHAFLVSEDDFDVIFGRITAKGLPYWPDPRRSREGEINHNDGGRGVYFPDPDGNVLELLTRPYGSGG